MPEEKFNGPSSITQWNEEKVAEEGLQARRDKAKGISSATDIAAGIRKFAADRRAEQEALGTIKQYIVCEHEYMDADGRMYLFRGTFTALLIHLLYGKFDEMDQETQTFIKVKTDEELTEAFNETNGDGQPYVQVWCIEDVKQVLGQKG